MLKKVRLISIVATIVALAACTKSGDEGVMRHLPADADFAAVLRMKTIVESAGGSVDGSDIKLPGDVLSLLGDDCGEMLARVARSGLDVENVGVCVFVDNPFCAVVFEIDDESGFNAFCDERKFDRCAQGSSLGLRCNGDYYIANVDGYAYLCESQRKDASAVADRISRLIESTKKSSLGASRFGRYINEGNGGGAVMSVSALKTLAMKRAGAAMPVYFVPEDASSRICLKLNLNEEEAVLTAKLLDADGKEIKLNAENFGLNPHAEISAEALGYMAPEESLILAMSLKDIDWEAAMNSLTRSMGLSGTQAIMAAMVRTYLEKIDGTVALGIGLDCSIEEAVAAGSSADLLPHVPVTLVVQVVPGKAKGIVGDLSAICATLGLRPASDGDAFSLRLPDAGVSLFVKAEGNNIVISTLPVKSYGGNSAVESSALAGAFSGFALSLPADCPALSGLGIDDSLSLWGVSAAGCTEGQLTLRITGATSGGIVARILALAQEYKKVFEKISGEVAEKADFTPAVEDIPDYDRFDGFEPTYF